MATANSSSLTTRLPSVPHESYLVKTVVKHPPIAGKRALRGSSLGSSIQSGLERGLLETWPVQSGTVTTLGSSKRRTTTNLQLPDRQPIIPKPRYLQQLERHLSTELRLLGCPPEGPHELRLQAHREVFEQLIEDFKTYRPLLSAIRNEYELYLVYQQEIIRELLPLQTKLHSVQDDCEKKIMAIREQERKDDEGIQDECRLLKLEIGKMRERERSYKAQVEKLQEELGKLYEDYRHEADARKLLVSDYTDLKARHQEQQVEDDGGMEKEDPTILKLKLARTRDDLRAAHLRINQMLADYGDVVPRREFEMLETSYRNMESEMDVLKPQFSTISEEHSTLLEMYKQLQAEKDKLHNELKRLKGVATPRPFWSKCAEFISGGPDKWAELSKGRSSNELVDVLLAEISGVDISEISVGDLFQAQGTSTNVPRYLRADGQINNKKMNRQELEELITGFWEFRTIQIAQGGGGRENTENTLDELLYSYLLQRNSGQEMVAIEDGYNLQDACRRFSHHTHIRVFSEILTGKLDEEVYDMWISTQIGIVEAFNKAVPTGQQLLTKSEFEQCLMVFFSGKPDQHLQALVQCAADTASTQAGQIDFLALMEKGVDHQPSPFVCQLLEQGREETKYLVENISKLLADKQEVTVAEVETAISSLDPSKPLNQIQSIVAKAFAIAPGQLSEMTSSSIPTDKFIKHLLSTSITRSGAPPPHSLT